MGATFWKLTNGIQAFADTADDFGGSDAPKQKFTFTAIFTFRSSLGVKGAEDMKSIKLALKTATRPSPIISYHEVNYNNFRTKVAVKADPGAVTITMYDDVKNRAHDIFEHYLTTVSPITNLKKAQADRLDLRGQDGGNESSASIGILNENRHGILHDIRITHHFGPEKIHYDYLNPKITTMTLDDLDMTVSEAPIVTLNFNYDSVNIVKNNGGADVGINGNIVLTEFSTDVSGIA